MNKGITMETINKIESGKYYRISEVLKLNPILAKVRDRWLINKIYSGELKAFNTSKNPKWPRYLIKGSDLIEFLNKEKLN